MAHAITRRALRTTREDMYHGSPISAATGVPRPSDTAMRCRDEPPALLECVQSSIGRSMRGFIDKVEKRTAVVGIIGQGYVGLPLGLVLCEAGLAVVGFDVEARKIHAISRGESYIKHIGPERVAAAVRADATRRRPTSIASPSATRS